MGSDNKEVGAIRKTFILWAIQGWLFMPAAAVSQDLSSYESLKTPRITTIGSVYMVCPSPIPSPSCPIKNIYLLLGS